MLRKPHLLKALLTRASAAGIGGDATFLEEAVFTRHLNSEDRQFYTELLNFARTLQAEDPLYESIYQQLMYLFILNGSRLEILKSIDRRLRGLVNGQMALILIGGVSGIGKTSLVMAFQERVHRLGGKFIQGRCFDHNRDSYHVWQAVARSADAAGFPIEQLSAPIGKGPEAFSPQHLKQALADWLTACSASQPLVILLDDLHWADVDSLEMLNYLTGQSISKPILFIATYRSEEAHLRHALYEFLPRLKRNRASDLVQLEPLTREDIQLFVTANQGKCTPELARYLHERAEGHPLFTAELLRDLVAQGNLRQDEDGRWLPPSQSVSVPIYLKQLITRRINRLGNPAMQLLSIAAVAGETWSLNIVEPLTGMAEEALLEVIEQALQANILTVEDSPDEAYRFAHGLFREVLYTSQLARRRKRIHAQIARQFEQQQPENVFAIAHHYYQAEVWEKAMASCMAAGDQATRRLANYSALGWYQQTLTAAEHSPEKGKTGDVSEIYDRLGHTYLALERIDEAEMVFSRMRDIAQSNKDLISKGRALVYLAQVRVRRYQLELAKQTAQEALKIGEQCVDIELITESLICLGGIFLVCGQLEQAEIHYRNALEHADNLGDSVQLLSALRQKAYLATWVGEYSQAEPLARQALNIAQKFGDPLHIVGSRVNLAFVQIESGQFKEAYDNIRATLDTLEASGSQHHQIPRLLNQMGYLHLELGDAQQALYWDQKALDAIREDQLRSIEMRRYSLLNKATDYLHMDLLEESQEAIAQFETIKAGTNYGHFRYFNRYQLLMSEFFLKQDKIDQAIELAQEARSLAQSKGIVKNVAKSHWYEGLALARSIRLDESLEQLEEAIHLVDGIQHGYLRWKIRLSLVEVLRKANKATEGVIWRVRTLIDQTSQSLAGAPLQEIFLASKWVKQIEDLEQNSAPEMPTYPAGLTEREVEVLQLVANGATNQQVADVLHISVRTVNTHMTNIMNKIGCNNRTAASIFAIQHHLVTT